MNSLWWVIWPNGHFQEFYVDHLFLGIGGISLEAGLTEFNLEGAWVKKAMLGSAKECTVVADASKLGNIAFASVAPLSAIHRLITDSSADRGIRRSSAGKKH